MSHRIKMRLSGTQADLEVWIDLVRKMAKHRVVDLLEVSAPYANEGESKFFRCYLELDLLVDPTDTTEQGGTEAPPDPEPEPAPSTLSVLPPAKAGRKRRTGGSK